MLALTGVDLLTNPDLLERVKADFREHAGEKPYVSPIPVDQKPPLPDRNESNASSN